MTATPTEENNVAEVGKAAQDKATKNPTQKKDESSDEEVDDELDLETQAINYGNIKEKKDIATNEKQEETEKQGYGFDTTAAAVSANQKGGEIKREKKDASEITFGGSRPKFGRKVDKGKFGAEFSEGLDDIDDDGNIKNKPKKNEFARADGGQREFINLGSKARVGGHQEEEKSFEPLSKATGIKPTFRGKLNLNKTGANADEGDYGVKTNYGFAVSYKTTEPGFIPGEGGKERKPREKGVPFGQHMAAKADDDEGFEVVKEKERKPMRKFNHNDSDSEEAPSDGTKITRGDARAPRGGRGGFFKNSTKREE